uniref:PPIase cyclophilin-type domain-containing protein n=1 Tax=Odontella aurita TaxID=265563 RepID=A0A7S4JIF2_9STRA|eukprot:CAMPEP_0113545804 /NCGR_PEP_ID=MMETSP0015_2-20120614/11461_1 /TAXON_ID=2838 /ORGANISM="Odontella" /LENGTH=400 /DNA_ID=CAMNT_0000446203 /DNA_START=47 /DNA_END=1249 /DNA_ORIENTATION=+ /assembly_acc=CAM_ASM_000160
MAMPRVVGSRRHPRGMVRNLNGDSSSRLMAFICPLVLFALAKHCTQAFSPPTLTAGRRELALGLSRQEDEDTRDCNPAETSRRSALFDFGAYAAATALVGLIPMSADAAVVASRDATALGDPSTLLTDDSYPPITQKVYLDVRISRQDGSFYVRDDLPDTPENRVYTGRLTLGLFGTVAPRNVEQFLRYADVPYNPADDNPLPSYARSRFTRLDQDTGMLSGGNIPGLELTEVGGGTNMKYGGKILPAPLWIEPRNKGASSPGDADAAAQTRKVSHALGSGLITHRTLDALPSFGITTRSSPELDNTHVVFGRVIPDESSMQFLQACVDLPTYSMDRPSTPAEAPRTGGERAAEEAAGRVFAVQREFFRGAAKTFGDSRVDKVYEGKLLRRVEVTRVGLL